MRDEPASFTALGARLPRDGPEAFADPVWVRQAVRAAVPRAVDLYRLDLDAPTAGLAVLSAQERGRAAGFHAPAVARRWIAARAGLRCVLGAVLGVAPEALRLATDSGGKPGLIDVDRPVAFNLSHAGQHALIAVTAGPAVGVDLEAPTRNADAAWSAIAARHFAPSELADLARNPGSARFLGHWTVKEAVLKAAGTGLAAPLGAVDSTRVVATGGGPIGFAGRTWLCRKFALPSGVLGAVAVDDGPYPPLSPYLRGAADAVRPATA